MPIETELIDGLIDDIRLRLAELRSQEVTEEKLKDVFFVNRPKLRPVFTLDDNKIFSFLTY